jgi:hypothetical protein
LAVFLGDKHLKNFGLRSSPKEVAGGWMDLAARRLVVPPMVLEAMKKSPRTG